MQEHQHTQSHSLTTYPATHLKHFTLLALYFYLFAYHFYSTLECEFHEDKDFVLFNALSPAFKKDSNIQ